MSMEAELYHCSFWFFICRRLLDKQFQLELTESTLDCLAKVGYDPVYGARPLKWAIREYLENPLAEAILSGQYSPGQTIQVGCTNQQLAFS